MKQKNKKIPNVDKNRPYLLGNKKNSVVILNLMILLMIKSWTLNSPFDPKWADCLVNFFVSFTATSYQTFWIQTLARNRCPRKLPYTKYQSKFFDAPKKNQTLHANLVRVTQKTSFWFCLLVHFKHAKVLRVLLCLLEFFFDFLAKERHLPDFFWSLLTL